MKNEEKAKFIAEQCKPCSKDFYSGIYQGVLLALNAEEQQLNKSLAFCKLFVDMCEGGMPHDRDLKNQAIEVINNSNLD
jgi:hypothetical protein